MWMELAQLHVQPSGSSIIA